MSTASPIDPDRTPADFGWRAWDGTAPFRPERFDLAVVPKTAQCSLTGCHDAPVAAVRRNPSGSRPAFWQPYCYQHAYDRGVEVNGLGLVWTEEFSAVSPRTRGLPSP